MPRLHPYTGLRRRLEFLRHHKSALSPYRVKTLLRFAGFRFQALSPGSGLRVLVGSHPAHPAIIQLDMGRNPVPKGFAGHVLDIIEELVALGVGK